MSETIRGKGVISGIAVGTVMLAGQNLDGYLAAYHPGTLAEEESIRRSRPRSLRHTA